MNKLGLLTTEFGMAVGVLAASYELASEALSTPNLSIGAGIAVAGAALAIAHLGGKYAQARTEVKKGEVQ